MNPFSSTKKNRRDSPSPAPSTPAPANDITSLIQSISTNKYSISTLFTNNLSALDIHFLTNALYTQTVELNFREQISSSSTLDGLKILQTMQVLITKYYEIIDHETLRNLLSMGFILHGTKNRDISNTASATLAQLFHQIYSSQTSTPLAKLVIYNDLINIFSESNTSIEQPKILDYKLKVSKSLMLDLIEQVLKTFDITERVDGIEDELTSNLLFPYLMTTFATSTNYPLTIRCFRLLTKTPLLKFLPAKLSQQLIMLFVQLLDPSASSLPWKKIGMLEVISQLCQDQQLLQQLALDSKCLCELISSLNRIFVDTETTVDISLKSVRPIMDNIDRAEPISQTSAEVSASMAALSLKSVLAFAMKCPCIPELFNEVWAPLLVTFSTITAIQQGNNDAEFWTVFFESYNVFLKGCVTTSSNSATDAFLSFLCNQCIPNRSPSFNGNVSLVANNKESSYKVLETMSMIVNSTGTLLGTEEAKDDELLNEKNLKAYTTLLSSVLEIGTDLKHSGWLVVVPALQCLDLIPASSSTGKHKTELEDLILKCNAIFENVGSFKEESYISLINVLVEMGENVEESHSSNPTPLKRTNTEADFRNATSPNGSLRGKRPSTVPVANHTMSFVMNKLVVIGSSNTSRYALQAIGWNTINSFLEYACLQTKGKVDVRYEAADALCNLISLSFLAIEQQAEIDGSAQQRCLLSLVNVINSQKSAAEAQRPISAEVYKRIMKLIMHILESHGHSLGARWLFILDMLEISKSKTNSDTTDTLDFPQLITDILLTKTCKSSFTCLNLLCTDFLSFLDFRALSRLAALIQMYSFQAVDLNLALTAVGLFWTLSDFLQNQSPVSQFTSKLHSTAGAETDLNPAIMVSSIWLQLVQRLSHVACDPRSDVRSQAAQTLFRTFDVHGPALNVNGWVTSYNHVLFPLLKKQITMGSVSGTDNNYLQKAWEESILLVYYGFAQVWEASILVLSEYERSSIFWEEYLQCLMLLRNSHNDKAAQVCWKILSSSLSAARKYKVEKAFQMWPSAWHIWSEDTAVSFKDLPTQEVLTVYVSCAEPLLHLFDSRIDNNDFAILTNRLYLCVSFKNSKDNRADMDYMTPLQICICQFLEHARSISTEKLVKLLDMMVNITTLTFDISRIESSTPYHQALSRHILQLIERKASDLCNHDITHSEGVFLNVLKLLATIICLKYKFPHSSERVLPFWQLASNVYLNLLDTETSYLNSHDLNSPYLHREILALVEAQKGILEGNGLLYEKSSQYTDEEFDVKVFLDSSTYLLPTIFKCDKSVQQYYVQILSICSLFYDTAHNRQFLFGEIKSAKSQINTPSIVLREHVAKVCLDTLFDISFQSQRHKNSIEIAKDYLYRRCYIAVQSFISAQSLRGRQPVSRIQLFELNHIISSLLKFQHLGMSQLPLDFGRQLRSDLQIIQRSLSPIDGALLVMLRSNLDKYITAVDGSFGELYTFKTHIPNPLSSAELSV